MKFLNIFSTRKCLNDSLSYDDIPAEADRELMRVSYPQQQISSVAALPTSFFVKRYAEDIHAVLDHLPMSKEDIDRLLMPTINALIHFVHLLPASENHHHSGTGGLFVHSLQCAAAAIAIAETKTFVISATHQTNHQNKTRWVLGACLTGLLHDVGKVFDINIVSAIGKTWNPNAESLMSWIENNKLDKYFVSWDAGRVNKQHELRSVRLIHAAMLSKDLVKYLCEFTNDEVLGALDDAVVMGTGPLAEVLRQAEACSIQKDADDRRHLGAEYLQASSPAYAACLFAMRSLLTVGRWTVNEPASPVFATTDGVFVRLTTSTAQAVHQAAADDGATHVPNQSDGLLRVLSDAGLLLARKENGADEAQWHWTFALPTLKNLVVSDAVKITDPLALFPNGIAAASLLPVSWDWRPAQPPARSRCFLAPTAPAATDAVRGVKKAEPKAAPAPIVTAMFVPLSEEECRRGSSVSLSAKESQLLADRVILTIAKQAAAGSGFLLQPVTVQGMAEKVFSTLPIETLMKRFRLDENSSELLFRLSTLRNTMTFDFKAHYFRVKEMNNEQKRSSAEDQSGG